MYVEIPLFGLDVLSIFWWQTPFEFGNFTHNGENLFQHHCQWRGWLCHQVNHLLVLFLGQNEKNIIADTFMNTHQAGINFCEQYWMVCSCGHGDPIDIYQARNIGEYRFSIHARIRMDWNTRPHVTSIINPSKLK